MTNEYLASLEGCCIYFDAYGATLYYDDDEVLILEIETSPGETFNIRLELECELRKITSSGSVFVINQDKAWEQFNTPYDPIDDIIDEMRIERMLNEAK
jgi:hypothetical protein